MENNTGFMYSRSASQKGGTIIRPTQAQQSPRIFNADCRTLYILELAQTGRLSYDLEPFQTERTYQIPDTVIQTLTYDDMPELEEVY